MFASCKVRLLLIAVCCWAASGCWAARILAVFPSPSKSHLIIHCAIAETLAEAGHNVTVIATMPNVYKRAKYNYLNVNGPVFDASYTREAMNKPVPIIGGIPPILHKVIDMANATLNMSGMKDFLHRHKAGDFDVLILGYFLNDFMIGLGAHFQCPIIVSFMVQSFAPLNDMVANPSEIAYVPSLFSGLQQPMDFWERVKNFVDSLMGQAIWHFSMKVRMQKLYDYNFPADRYPPMSETIKNVSLLLINHHFSQGPVRPNVPSVIEIGGIQIKEKTDPLPEDIAQIMDSAKNGVIYFSLGTIMEGSILSKNSIQSIFNVLANLPYKVLVKWPDHDYPSTAGNIVYREWLPQNDILAHPKVKLFITHGGQGSVVEAEYHGVPMIGIPLFGDQHSNIARVVKSGFGLQLDYKSLNEATCRAAITEVLNNPKYSSAIKEFSRIYRDRPMSPHALVRYWVDYVVRHKGAKHMQSPAVHLNWFELHSLDVIAVLLSIIFSVLSIVLWVSKWLWCCCKGLKVLSTKTISKSKKNKSSSKEKQKSK